MNKYICVRESFDYIYLGDGKDKLSDNEYRALQKYLEENIRDNTNVIEGGYNKIRFINYVGVLKIKNVTIEVLPKISFSNDKNKDRRVLLAMLSKCLDLDINLDKFINSNTQNYSLLDLIANKYLELLMIELNKGIFREYVNYSDNLKMIRGKIVLKEHINKNYANKDRVFCSFDEYSENILLNQVLKFASEKILRNINDMDITKKCNKALFKLSNVDRKYINKEILSRVQINKQNKRFLQTFELAKFIILNMSNDSGRGMNKGFSMLFDMNTLYEKYIGKVIREIFINKKVYLQDSRKYLLDNKSNNKQSFNLRPDIVIQDNVSTTIIDMKWKAVEYNSKNNYEVSDIYKMYAYASRYKDAKKAVLLYPSLEEGKEYEAWTFIDNVNKKIEIKTVRLDSYNNTVKDLEDIIN